MLKEDVGLDKVKAESVKPYKGLGSARTTVAPP